MLSGRVISIPVQPGFTLKDAPVLIEGGWFYTGNTTLTNPAQGPLGQCSSNHPFWLNKTCSQRNSCSPGSSNSKLAPQGSFSFLPANLQVSTTHCLQNRKGRAWLGSVQPGVGWQRCQGWPVVVCEVRTAFTSDSRSDTHSSSIPTHSPAQPSPSSVSPQEPHCHCSPCTPRRERLGWLQEALCFPVPLVQDSSF